MADLNFLICVTLSYILSIRLSVQRLSERFAKFTFALFAIYCKFLSIFIDNGLDECVWVFMLKELTYTDRLFLMLNFCNHF